MKTRLLYYLSIRQKLPLFICGLILAIVLNFGILSYLGVRKAALKTADQRLKSLSFQLSDLLSAQTNILLSTSYEKANTSAVQKFVRSGGSDSAQVVENWLRELQKDSNNARVDLLDINYKKLAGTKQIIKFKIDIDSLFPKTKRAQIGKIYSVNHVMVYPVIAEIADSTRPVGYFVRWRVLRSSSQLMERLTNLMGDDLRIYVGNADSSLWTDLTKPLSVAQGKKLDKNNIIELVRSDGRWLASIHAVASSPWLVSIEVPKETVLESASEFLHWLIIGGSILIVVGMCLGWLMARNLSEPLVRLTDAASKIASGQYPSPVLVNRKDEVGKLARAFNAMAVQISKSQKELEENALSYKLLFEKNPMPMWIMQKGTLKILDVNEAAVRHYGYSKEEFLNLNAIELRPQEDISQFLDAVPGQLNGRKKHGIWRHKKKDGSMISVDMTTDDTLYKNEIASLTLADDVTEKLQAEAELMKNRIMQQELITETTILAQEKEREEIGKELHDNINQILASTKLYLELARNGNENLIRGCIEKSYENINQAMAEIRQLSKQLVKPSFDTSLKESLRDLTDELQAITQINIQFDAIDFNEHLVDQNVKLMIYRIIQEQVNNILKHSAAAEVRILLKTTIESVHFCVEDDGVGFDMSNKAKGIGLRNIDNRVKFHKGRLTIESAPGEGCRLAIEVPLKHELSLYN